MMENSPQAPLNRSPGKEGKKRFPVKRTIALVLFLFLLIGLGLHAPVKEYVSSVQESAQKIIEFGWKGHIIFLFGVTLLILLGMPRLLFCAIGGMAFGWWLGLIYAVAATLLAYYLQFLFVRWGGRPFVEKYLKKYPVAGKFIRDEGLGAVILARQVPLPGIAINFAFGLSTVRNRDYIFGTLIGQIPEALPCALVGAGLLETSGKNLTWMLFLAVVAFAVLWVGFNLLLRYLRNKNNHAERRKV
ncbi:MAG: TVP38/TMEM64 family protein [Verrucomicrobia bacterium]|nr:TVP38/TMEM64 family protein [Verrucomicrobiota bacterium]